MPELKIADDIAKRLAQFTPTDIDFDDRTLDDEQRELLKLLVQAARIIDTIFLDQVGDGVRALRERLVATKAPPSTR